MRDPADRDESARTPEPPRRHFALDDRGFDEVPAKYRRFYRHWQGRGDQLGPNEVICPVCKVVIRSSREIRPGDRLYCMACMTRLRVRQQPDGALEADCEY